jgi:hypothetical protein
MTMQVVEGQQVALSTTPDIMTIVDQIPKLLALGDTLLKSGMIPQSVKSKEAAVAILLKGQELGLGPMESFSSINVIQGKPTVSPQLMMGLAERTGALVDYQITDDGQEATCTVTRRGRTPFSASFSMADANAMKTKEDGKMVPLSQKWNWKSQPKTMRQWRAVSAAFRVVFPDVLAGIYTHEEMGVAVDEETGEPSQMVEVEVVDTQKPVPKTAPQPADATNDTEATQEDHDVPWGQSEAIAPFMDFFNEAGAKLGADFFNILGQNACETVEDIATEAAAKVIVAEIRQASKVLDEQEAEQADLLPEEPEHAETPDGQPD